jgi:hypothetical protein
MIAWIPVWSAADVPALPLGALLESDLCGGVGWEPATAQVRFVSRQGQ